MRLPTPLAATVFTLALAACSTGDRTFTPDAARADAAITDAPPAMDRGPAFDVPPPDRATTCVAGVTYCAGADYYTCDATGAVDQRGTCAAPLTCVQGRGCLACDPSSARCDPTMLQRAQSCRADGSGWSDGVTCDAAMGQTCVAGHCVDRCSDSALGNSYVGCDYWPTVTANAGLDPTFQFAVVLANPQTYAVHATITGGALDAPRNVTLAPGAVETVVLPWVVPLVQLDPAAIHIGPFHLSGNPAVSVLQRNGAYHVHGDGPFTAYQFNPLTFMSTAGYYSYTNDASLLLPQGVLTQHYTVVTYRNFPWMSGKTQYWFGGFVAVVGVTGETTDVTVHLAGDVRAGTGVPAMHAGETRLFTLQPGDVLQLVGTGDGDLTGTTIEATNRVAVFGGHDCTNVPTDRVACDHLEEQLLPNETLGQTYVVSALRDRGPTVPSLVRILSRGAANHLVFDPPDVHPEVDLGAGELLELQSARHYIVRGTQPFAVMQFMIGQGDDRGGAGDPAMVVEVPVEQYRSSYDFTVPGTYVSNFVDVVVTGTGGLVLDGTPVRGSSEPLGAYTVYTLPIGPGNHHLGSADGQPLGLKVYGVAPYTSYAYPAGLDLARITPG